MILSKVFHPLSYLILLNLSLARAIHIGYTATLTIVIVELHFAFSVGIICVIFSVYLLQALKDQTFDATYTQQINLPDSSTSILLESEPHQPSTTYSTFMRHSRSRQSFETDMTIDTEQQIDIGKELDPTQYDGGFSFSDIFHSISSFLGY